MSSSSRVLKAYGSAAALRSQREQDAEIFRRVSAGLRAVSDEMSKVRAVADARRLWQTVLAASHDPLNPLPASLRAQIISVANTAIRSLDNAQPNLPFLAEIGDNFAAGLSGQR